MSAMAASLHILRRFDPACIDYEMARGGNGCEACTQADAGEGVANAFRGLLPALRDRTRDRAVVVFLACTVLFHFANAAMVPLVTQLLARDQGARTGVMLTSGYMVASQAVFIVAAAASGRLAGRLGRKPLLVFAFASLRWCAKCSARYAGLRPRSSRCNAWTGSVRAYSGSSPPWSSPI